ncbi:MAG: glycosyltransferase family 2 protein [Candidatus Electrothrix sp. AR3]|nr:glycosyltransferase family 2 protein [Candidatus Electrothrix sp. AR3]
MPKISVVIPCYNHGQYIDEAVHSILQQTYTNFEIIIVNDGSTDSSTIKKLKNYDKPQTVVFHIKNQGPSAARNFGISKSCGCYILVLDADDYFEPTFLQKAVEILEKKESVGIVACGIQFFGLNNKKYLPDAKGVESFLVNCSLRGSALFRKICWEQTGGYNESMKNFSYEDWNFWLDITKIGWNVFIIQEYLFCYRWHESSRRMETHKIRLAAIQQLVENHKELYSNNAEYIFCEQEKKIIELKKKNRFFQSSLEYRLGTTLLIPLRFLQKKLRHMNQKRNNA